jgi:hypothetical protein
MIIQRGASIGLDWPATLAELQQLDWESRMSEATDPLVGSYPDYYTQPFHAYKQVCGVLNFQPVTGIGSGVYWLGCVVAGLGTAQLVDGRGIRPTCGQLPGLLHTALPRLQAGVLGAVPNKPTVGSFNRLCQFFGCWCVLRL